ncbi:MAG: RNA methyltransferase [Gemmatimonadetes bacterium]|nr:RNA methyltransferase [Gemmatimonadota bacterium]
MGRNLHSLVRDLQRRKRRERRGLVVAEGRRLVEDALAAGSTVVALLVADDVAEKAAAPLLAAAVDRGIQVEVATRQDFDALADTETPSGVMAVIEWTPLPLERAPTPDGPRATVLVLDGVQDPGNVGTMIRTAHALGAWMTVALDGTADVASPKVIRSAMGGVFRHRVAQASFDAFAAYADRAGLEVWLAVQDGWPVTLNDPTPARLALVVGNEGGGVREAWASRPHRRVTIPMRPGAESLNAGVAAGILLYELTRAPR